MIAYIRQPGGRYMDLWSRLRRRWILACSLLLLTLIATTYSLLKLPSTYQSTSSVVFLVSKNAAKYYGGNSYMAFTSALNITADVVRYGTNDTRTVSLLSSEGYKASYLVTDATDTSGPVLIATVTGKNKAMVEHTLYGVTNEIGAKLQELQANITPNNKIQSLVITFNWQPTVVASKKARPISVIAGAGVALSIGIPFFIDAILISRRNTKNAGDENTLPRYNKVTRGTRYDELVDRLSSYQRAGEDNGMHTLEQPPKQPADDDKNMRTPEQPPKQPADDDNSMHTLEMPRVPRL
jgi:hypothetical protein